MPEVSRFRGIIITMYYNVTNFEIVGPYKLRLTFNDGTEQLIDFEPVLYEAVFTPLRALSLFNQVQLNSETGTIEWLTGADFSPVVLHDWPQYQDAIIRRLNERHVVPA